MSRESLASRYQQLAPRDQRILRIGAIAVLLILLVWIFVPLQKALGAARKHVADQQSDLEWMNQVAPTLAAAGPGVAVAAATPESLVVLIDSTARESGLGASLAGSQPAGNGAMRVSFENADFNLLSGWLSRLSTQHGVHVDAATVTATSGPGMVNASVQLRAP